jgi:hydrocephalus-inducing protein
MYLVNMGNVNYDYVWTTGNNSHVSVTPETGSVPKGSRVLCELLYSPKTSEILENYRIACQVVNASKYQFSLSGQGHQPKVDFSFYRYVGTYCVWLLFSSMAPPDLSHQILCDDNTLS